MAKITYLPKSDQDGVYLIGHRIDYNGVEFLRG